MKDSTMPHGPALLEHLQARQADMVAALAEIVAYESPSRDKAALDDLARWLAARFGTIGAEVAVIENPRGGDHVRVRYGEVRDPESGCRPGLVLCHFDTVWPRDTAVARPFRLEAGRAYGPGVYDMKSSLVIVESALRALRALGLRPPRPVRVLLTSDEEIGSLTSRDLIETEARASDYVLVMEPPLPDGRLKTARKGVGHFHVEIEGRAAHAGVEPEKGVSAVLELAHQILSIHGLANPAAGTTINVGVVQGGTTSNVVPAYAHAHIDVRVTTLDEAQRVEAALHALRPRLAGANIVLSGHFDRPPMERGPGIVELFGRAREIAREQTGLELEQGSTGGASDGNLTAALGVPTLDGLGALGAGAHAIDEHVLIESLPVRAALLACLLLEL
jgi:glutamate carboxypeptidase